MSEYAYDSNELNRLHKVLEGIIAEAQRLNLPLPADDIIERMYDLCDEGERDPEKLREAILKDAA